MQPSPASVRDFGWNHPAYRSFATIDRRALNRFFELGCTEGQGYLFNRPLSADEWSTAFESGAVPPKAAPCAEIS